MIPSLKEEDTNITTNGNDFQRYVQSSEREYSADHRKNGDSRSVVDSHQ